MSSVEQSHVPWSMEMRISFRGQLFFHVNDTILGSQNPLHILASIFLPPFTPSIRPISIPSVVYAVFVLFLTMSLNLLTSVSPTATQPVNVFG